MLAVLAVVAVACSADPPTVTEAPAPKVESHRPKKSAEAVEPERAATYLVYVRKHRLRGFDLGSGQHVELGTVPGPDVVLSPDGQRVAVVTDLDPGGDPEGFSDPQISVATIDGDDATALGPGRSPRWSPDGVRIAAITDDGIVSYDVGTTGATPVLEGEVWSLFGWSGEQVAAVGPDGASLTAPGDEPRFLRLAPSTVWGISPTGPAAIVAEESTATVVGNDSETDIDLEGALGDGSFAPDGSKIAAVVIGSGTALVVIDPDTGTTRYPPEGAGAQGNVVWAADSQSFAFVRVNPDDRLELQAVVCSRQLMCEPAFSWGQGVTLLGFSSLNARA